MDAEKVRGYRTGIYAVDLIAGNLSYCCKIFLIIPKIITPCQQNIHQIVKGRQAL